MLEKLLQRLIFDTYKRAHLPPNMTIITQSLVRPCFNLAQLHSIISRIIMSGKNPSFTMPRGMTVATAILVSHFTRVQTFPTWSLPLDQVSSFLCLERIPGTTDKKKILRIYFSIVFKSTPPCFLCVAMPPENLFQCPEMPKKWSPLPNGRAGIMGWCWLLWLEVPFGKKSLLKSHIDQVEQLLIGRVATLWLIWYNESHSRPANFSNGPTILWLLCEGMEWFTYPETAEGMVSKESE